MRWPIGLAAQSVTGMSPWQTVEVAAAAGFDRVGVVVDPEIWPADGVRRVRDAIAATGLVLQDVEVIRLDGAVTDAIRRIVDVAAELGAPHIITISLAPDAARTADLLAGLADYVAGSGTTPILEFGRFTSVGTIGAAQAFAAAAGLPILVDPLHLARSGGTPEELRRVPAVMLPYVQVCDAGPPPDDSSPAALLAEARDRRLDVGEGLLDLAGFLAALPPETPLMNEVRSAALAVAMPDPLARARYLARTMRAWLRRMGEAE